MASSRRPPSYHQGFARSAGESAYPNGWDGLVGAWVPALGPTGATLRDRSVFKNDGTLTNMDPATDWLIGGNPHLPGYALDFDGINDGVVIGNVPRLAMTGSMTLLAWVKLDTLTGTINIIAYGTTDETEETNFLWALSLDGDTLRAFWEHGAGVNELTLSTSVSGITIGEWNRLGLVRTTGATSSLKFFINGRQNGNTISGITNPSGGTVAGAAIGQPGLASTQRLDGQVNEVLIYGRPFSDAEMQLDFERPLRFLAQRRRVFGFVAPVGGPSIVPPRSLPRGVMRATTRGIA